MSDLDLAAFERAAGVAVDRSGPSDLADVLERVLDTGIVVAGEIRIDLLDIELLTIRLRLVITSIDKAEEVGLDWWRGDSWYSTPGSEVSRGPTVRDDAVDGEVGRAIPVVDVAADDRFEILPDEVESSTGGRADAGSDRVGR